MDSDFRFTIMNSALVKMVDVQKKDAIGQIPWDVLPFLKDTPVEKNMKKTMAGELTGNLEVSFTCPAGKRHGFGTVFRP